MKKIPYEYVLAAELKLSGKMFVIFFPGATVLQQSIGRIGFV